MARGEALWNSVTKGQTFDAAGYVLLEDACRTADIIAQLEYLLANDEAHWLNILEEAGFESPKEKRVILNVRPLLGEIRQQRLAMRQLMNQLGIAHLTSGEVDTESQQSTSFWAAKEAEFKEG
jgi:hypothetical protein